MLRVLRCITSIKTVITQDCGITAKSVECLRILQALARQAIQQEYLFPHKSTIHSLFSSYLYHHQFTRIPPSWKPNLFETSALIIYFLNCSRTFGTIRQVHGTYTPTWKLSIDHRNNVQKGPNQRYPISLWRVPWFPTDMNTGANLPIFLSNAISRSSYLQAQYHWFWLVPTVSHAHQTDHRTFLEQH